MVVLDKYCTEMAELLNGAIKKIEDNETLLDAYLYRSRIRCGRASCKCMSSDYRHESDCISFTEEGKSRTRTVHEAQLPELNILTSEYKDLRTYRKKLVSVQKKMLESFDKEVNIRLNRGRKRLESLLAAKKEAIGE